MQKRYGLMRVLSLNLGAVQTVRINGRGVRTAIGKAPVTGPFAVGLLGLAGDEQADPSMHGGLSKAVYLYPVEHHAFWRTVRAQAGVAAWAAPIAPGLFGENLSVEGDLTEDRLWIGDQLHFPDAVLAVSEPRHPCFKFNAALGFPHAARLMLESGFCGAYLGVVVPGTLRAGDPIRLEPGPRAVNLRELFKARVAGRRD
jgi:MOSC domain-containing protein YiiM